MGPHLLEARFPRSTIHIHGKVARRPVCSLCLTMDHSATCLFLFCFFVFSFFLFFFFWFLKQLLFFLRVYLVFRFFDPSPDLPSPSLLLDRGVEAAEPISEQLKPLLQWCLAGCAAGCSAGKLVQVHPWHIGHQFIFPSWDPCAPHLCVKGQQRDIRSQGPSQQCRQGAQLRRVHVHPCCRLRPGRLSPKTQTQDAARVQREDGSGLWSLKG